MHAPDGKIIVDEAKIKKLADDKERTKLGERKEESACHYKEMESGQQFVENVTSDKMLFEPILNDADAMSDQPGRNEP